MSNYSGDSVRISGTFTNLAGALTDPTDLSLVIKAHPTGAATTVQYSPGDIVRDSAGAFHYDWTAATVTDHTTYLVQWIATGAVQQASVPDRIYVAPVLA